MKAAALLQEAIALEARGDLTGATNTYRQILAAEPSHADALFLLGRAHCQRGEFEAGGEALRKLITMRPDHAAAHNLAGMVLERLGHTQQALACFERALAVDPNFEMALVNKADALAALDRHAEALASYDRALTIDGGNVVSWCNRGNTLAALGHDVEAAESFTCALALAPDLGEAHYGLAKACERLKRDDEAVAHYHKTVALQPQRIDAHLSLGNMLWERRNWAGAAASFQQVTAMAPANATAHFLLGRALFEAERYDESLVSLDKALAIEPGNADVLRQRGQVLFTLGRSDEARAALERALVAEPRDAAAYRLLGAVMRFAPDDPHLAAMEQVLRDCEALTPDAQIDLHFALSKAYGDADQPKRGFQHLLQGNALKRRQIHYDEAAVLGTLARIAETFTPDLMRRMAGGGDPSALPIFIIGMPRSGTTLVEQILAAHPSVQASGERQDFAIAIEDTKSVSQGPYPRCVTAMTPAQLASLGTNYIKRVTGALPNAERFTDKLPSNFIYAGLIHLALPNARIIHTKRDPLDTCLSCFSILFAGQQRFAYDLAELGRHYRAYEDLMAHWRNVLPDGVMLEVPYEEVVADTEAQARRILAHCGLPWDDACLAFHTAERAVRTASAAQVRQPIYRNSVGRWRAYEDELGPLIEALGLDR